MLIVKKIKILSYCAALRELLRRKRRCAGPKRNGLHGAALWLSLLWALSGLPGCGSGGSGDVEAYLLRCGDRSVTAREFLEALELVKTAYPSSLEPGAAAAAEARSHLLDELAAELVMSRRADELGLAVADGELDAAVAAVAADYPPGVFERTLVESAVSPDSWKRRLRARLLMEKVMAADLQDAAGVTAEEVAQHYGRHYRGRAAAADSQELFQQLKESIVADLRRQKTEAAYGDWIKRLREKFPVEINSEEWRRLQGSSGAAGGS
ncbi:MAG: SurA N-terminal domain-containing protein [Desulfobacterales bacterium]|jgi:hypothetical protein|nr:SurA N-terminal domain-containing protein [Desulfobacterales bacterium]